MVVLTRAGRRALLGSMRDHAVAIRSLFLDLLEPDEKRAIADAVSRVRGRLADESGERQAG